VVRYLKLLQAFSGLLLLWIQIGCKIERPAVTTVNSNGGTAKFLHSGLEPSCSVCHESKRPAPSLNSQGTTVPHGGGNDCVLCHQAGGAWINLIPGAAFSHQPVPTSCSSCHQAVMPLTVVQRMNHQIPNLPDCKECHLANIGTSWSGGSFTHSQTLTGTCMECHLGDRPSAPVSYSTSSGTQVYDHAVSGTGDCVNCHQHAGVTWSGGNYSHNPTPTTCISCHINQRPTGVVQGFDHASGGTGDCVACHQNPGGSWSGAITIPHPTSGLTNQAPYSGLQCATCHGQGGISSRQLQVPAANHMGGTGNSCISCHANFSAFTGATTSTTQPILKYAHTNSTAPMNDCRTCHSFSNGSMSAFSTPSWSLSQSTVVTASFSGTSRSAAHTDPKMTNCMACHQYVPYSATSSTAQIRWKFTHRPSNPGWSNTQSSVGCNLCH